MGLDILGCVDIFLGGFFCFALEGFGLVWFGFVWFGCLCVGVFFLLLGWVLYKTIQNRACAIQRNKLHPRRCLD